MGYNQSDNRWTYEPWCDLDGWTGLCYAYLIADCSIVPETIDKWVLMWSWQMSRFILYNFKCGLFYCFKQ